LIASVDKACALGSIGFFTSVGSSISLLGGGENLEIETQPIKEANKQISNQDNFEDISIPKLSKGPQISVQT
jgi:hypothetical protein